MSHEPIILPYKGIYPKIADDAWVAPGAVIIGDVEWGPMSLQAAANVLSKVNRSP